MIGLFLHCYTIPGVLLGVEHLYHYNKIPFFSFLFLSTTFIICTTTEACAVCICTSQRKNSENCDGTQKQILPAFHINLLPFHMCGQKLNSHRAEIYIDRSRNTNRRETEREKALLICRRKWPRCKPGVETKLQFWFFFHAQLLTFCTVHNALSMAKEALMGFSFHFSSSEEAHGHTNEVWPDAFGCISVAGNSNRSSELLLLHCPYVTMMDLFNFHISYW